MIYAGKKKSGGRRLKALSGVLKPRQSADRRDCCFENETDGLPWRYAIKVYTGTGDRGKTSLFSGERVGKGDRRVAAYGDVDELNAVIGAAMAALSNDQAAVRERATGIQYDLFLIGAYLATTPGSPIMGDIRKISESHIREMEKAIDDMSESMPDLKNFILPAGNPAAAGFHVARTVCRRAERTITVLFQDDETGAPEQDRILTYVNRLSDYLFVLARYCNHLAGTAEEVWKS